MKSELENGLVNNNIFPIWDHYHSVPDYQKIYLFSTSPAYNIFPQIPFFINIITVKDVDKWKNMKNGKTWKWNFTCARKINKKKTLNENCDWLHVDDMVKWFFVFPFR